MEQWGWVALHLSNAAPVQVCDGLAVTLLGPGTELRGLVLTLAFLQPAARQWEASGEKPAAMQSGALASRASFAVSTTEHIIRLCWPLPPAITLSKENSFFRAPPGTRVGSAGTRGRCCGNAGRALQGTTAALHASFEPVQQQAHLSHSCHKLPLHLLLALHQLPVHLLLHGQLMPKLDARLLQDSYGLAASGPHRNMAGPSSPCEGAAHYCTAKAGLCPDHYIQCCQALRTGMSPLSQLEAQNVECTCCKHHTHSCSRIS